MKTSSILFAVFTAAVLLFFLSFSSPQTTFDKLSVREFELLDTNGKKRASIKVESDGQVVFRLMDSEGTIRVKIGADKSGSGLVLLDGQTNPAIHALARTDKVSLEVKEK
jgi:hypothetical protein